jgi:hypothetical protein
VNLGASGYCKGASIRGSGIVDQSDFAKKILSLKEYPLNCPVNVISAGTWNEGGTSIKVENIGISIYSIGSVGRLILRLRLFEDDFEYGSLGFGCGGTLDFHFTYSGLSALLDGLESLILGSQEDFELSDFGSW